MEKNCTLPSISTFSCYFVTNANTYVDMRRCEKSKRPPNSLEKVKSISEWVIKYIFLRKIFFLLSSPTFAHWKCSSNCAIHMISHMLWTLPWHSYSKSSFCWWAFPTRLKWILINRDKMRRMWQKLILLPEAECLRLCSNWIQIHSEGHWLDASNEGSQAPLRKKSYHLDNLFYCKSMRKMNTPGLRMRRAWPFPPSPRAVRPTRWMYSFGSSGGSNLWKKNFLVFVSLTISSFFQVNKYFEKKGIRSLVRQPAQSSQHQGYPTLLLLHQYTKVSQNLHCRTGRTLSYALSAFAFPKTEYGLKSWWQFIR